MSLKQKLINLSQKIAHVVFVDLSKSAQVNLQRFYTQLVENILLKYPENLIKYGFSAYSQNEEDGIIAEIFKRLSVHNITFIEFGVHATENNTMNLLINGGRGTWVDKGLTNFKKDLQKNKKLNIVDEFVVMDNIFDIYSSSLSFLELKANETVDFLSLDLDGNDYYFVNQLLTEGARPKVFCLEYNPKFRTPTNIKIEYNSAHQWENSDDYYGCSLQAYVELLKDFDYTLVVCNVTGSNCIFIKKEYISHFKIYSEAELYQPGRDFLSPMFKGKPASMKYLLNLVSSTSK
jgi:hypothetical protein